MKTGNKSEGGRDASLAATLMLVSSFVSAACLGMMGFTLATGRLPFGLEPMKVEVEAPREVQPDEAMREDHEMRSGERFVARLFAELEENRLRLKQQQEKLAERERVIEESSRSAELREKALARMEDRIRSLLDEVEQVEVANVKQMGDMLGQADAKAATEMLLEMDEELAARVLFFMDERSSAGLVNVLMKKDDETKNKAARLMERVHRISEKLES